VHKHDDNTTLCTESETADLYTQTDPSIIHASRYTILQIKNYYIFLFNCFWICNSNSTNYCIKLDNNIDFKKSCIL